MKAVGVRRGTLAGLARTSDFVTVHATEAESARRMLDAAFFARMKEGAYFLNTSGGGLVDQAALIDVLDTGRLRGLPWTCSTDIRYRHPVP